MKSKRNWECLFASLCLSLIVLSSCGNTSKNTIVSQNHDNEIELKVFGYKTEAVNVQAIEKILQDYMKENKHVNITYESVKGVEYYEVLSKRIQSGNCDDIFMIDEDNLNKWKNKGLFEDLSGLASIKKYSKVSYEQMKQEDGTIPYVPTSISAFGLYCNLDILEKYGLKVPENNKEFLTICQYFVDKGITPIIANNDISLKTVAIAKGLSPIYQGENKSQMLDSLNQDSQMLSDYLKNGYTYVKMLIDKGYVDAEVALQTEKTKDDLKQFEEGKQPFMLTGAWAAVRVEKDAPDLNFKVYPYPILDNGSILLTNIDTRICVNAKGKHVEEAKAFLSYFTQEDVMWKFVNSQSSFSPLNDTRIAEDNSIQPLSNYMNEDMSMLGSDEDIKLPLWKLTREGMEKLLDGQSVETALEPIKKYKR